MSEFETLYLVLIVVYLAQCFHWAPAESTVFRSSGWGRWRLSRRAISLAAWKRKGILLQVQPPLGSAATLYDLPVVFSPHAVSAAFSGGTAPAEVPFAAKQKISAAEKSILIDGKILAATHSLTQARHLTSVLQQLAGANPKKREATIGEELGSMLDTRKIEKRLRRFRQFSRGVRLNANFLFIYLFVIAPLLVRFSHIGILWPFLLAMLLGLMAITAVEFYRVHKLFYPEEKEGRWSIILPVVLSPVAAVRACDSLWNGLFHGFHPVAVARVLCSDEEFEVFAARYLREMQYPLPTVLALENETQRYFRERSTKVLGAMLAAHKKLEKITRPPQPESTQSAMYCPRCWSQYHSEIRVCRDCADLPLERFNSTPTSAKAEL